LGPSIEREENRKKEISTEGEEAGGKKRASSLKTKRIKRTKNLKGKEESYVEK